MANINQSTLSIFPSRQSRCNVTELRTKRKIAIMSIMMHRKDSWPYESTDYEHEVLKAWKCQQKLVYIHQWWHDYWRSYMTWIAIGSKNSLRCGQMWSYYGKACHFYHASPLWEAISMLLGHPSHTLHFIFWPHTPYSTRHSPSKKQEHKPPNRIKITKSSVLIVLGF